MNQNDYALVAQTAVTSLPRVLAAAPLPLLVQMVLDTLILDKRSFTAFDVTMILRAMFPTGVRWLPHYDVQGAEGVQPVVHQRMEQMMTTHNYTRELLSYGKELAWTYSPEVDAVQCVIPNVWVVVRQLN